MPRAKTTRKKDTTQDPTSGEAFGRRLAKMRKIEQLPKRDQQAIMRTIDAFLSRA